MPLLNIVKILLFFIVIIQNIITGRTITKIVDETNSYIIIRTSKSFRTEADLAPNFLFIGLPKNNYPKTEIISIKKQNPLLKLKKKATIILSGKIFKNIKIYLLPLLK